MRDPGQRFKAVFEDAYEPVVRFAQRRTDPARAEDIAAETFLVAWRRVRELPTDPGDARAWLFGIARNCLLNETRGVRRRTALAVRLAGVAESAQSPDHSPALVDRLALGAAWDQLGPDEQECLALTIFDGLSSPQAGEVLGISAGAYRLRLTRARAALRRHLNGAAITPALEEARP